MKLSSDLIAQFAKATKDDTPKKKETTVYGTVKKYSGKLYVQIDGSELMTPVETTADLEDGERAMVQIKDHTATVIGNMTSPSARTETVKTLSDDIIEARKVIAEKADFTVLQAEIARINDLETNKLDAKTAQITYATIGDLDAAEANIKNLQTDKLDAKTAEITYANIDFSNIDIATIGQLFANSGVIKDVVIKDGHVTGKLVGVTIIGDLIEGGTVVADKLVIKGDDGLYYKLNTDGESVSSEQTEYNSLNGSIITANTITADKINVTDLVAFGATIGGYHIDENALYSGSKKSIDNTTKGVFLGSDGQMNIGDSNNFVKYYKDQNGNYKVEIQASSIKFGTSNKSVEETINAVDNKIDTTKQTIDTDIQNVNDKVDNIQIGGRNLVLKSNNEKTCKNNIVTYDLSDYGIANILGKTITVSFDVKADVADKFDCYIRSEKSVVISDKLVVNATTEWVRCFGTIKVNTSDVAAKWFAIRTTTAGGSTGTSTVTVKNVKVELGNKHTDWTPAPEDVDSNLSTLENAINESLSDLRKQVDGKIETFSQTMDPSTNWTTTELKTAHTGDIWYNSDTKLTQRWSGTAWVNLENAEAQAAATLAGKKAQIFTSQPTIPYYKGDLWVTALDNKGAIKTCKTSRTTGSYTSSDWVDLKYTDDTAVNNLEIGNRNLWYNSAFLEPVPVDETLLVNGTDNCEVVDLEEDNVTGFTKAFHGTNGKGGIALTRFSTPTAELVGKTLRMRVWIKYAGVVQGENTWNKLQVGKGTITYTLDDDTTSTVTAAIVKYSSSMSGFEGDSDWICVEGSMTLRSDVKMVKFSPIRIFLENATSGEFWCTGIQLSYGNRLGDWSPAPEDIDRAISTNMVDVYKTIDDQRTAILSETNSLILKAAEDYVANGDYLSFKETVEAQLKVLSDNITMNFTTTSNAISDLETSTTDELTTIKKYFQFDGDNGLTIGSGTSAIKLTVDNDDGIIFTKNGERFGYWDGNDFYTGNIVVQVNERAQFGNYAYVPRADGSLQFLKVK